MTHQSPEAEPIRPLVEELIPAPDPWEVCLRLSALPNLLFLDSCGGGPALRRYSYITAFPFDWLWTRGAKGGGDPLAVLRKRLRRYNVATLRGLPPFQGGAAGLFGYDLCHQIERLPRPRRDEFRAPLIAVGFYNWVISFDHAQGRAWFISAGLGKCDPLRRLRARISVGMVRECLARRRRFPLRIMTGSEVDPGPRYALANLPGVYSNFDRPGYLKAIRRAVEYIHAGDCFQVNLSQRLLHKQDVHPLELYRRLRERNPAPFAGYFDLGSFVIASASPERFLRVEKGAVETRPIKGTRPRGATPDEDRRLIDDLMHSAKDRSENVMIVDLLRNDLGRVCSYGSISVPAVCQLETYEHVHHLVSEVRGRLRPEKGPVDLLRAAFPGGSVTGAPKVRAMEIIAELEPTARGPYCGGLGYIGFDGSMDTNILIRTFTIGRGWMQFPVGGGIVADSKPEDEYAETLHKAEGLLRALRD